MRRGLQYKGIRLMVHRIMVQSSYLFNFLPFPFYPDYQNKRAMAL